MPPRTERARSAALLCTLLALAGCATDPLRRIPLGEGWGSVPAYVGQPAVADPLPPMPVREHPYLAAQGRNGMHQDSSCSEVSPWPGPLGVAPEVRSASLSWIGGEAATVTFDSRGRLILMSGNPFSFRLLLLDPVSLEVLAEQELPQRESMREFFTTWDWKVVMNDTSGGAYFHLGRGDRPIVADARRTIRVFAVEEADGRPRWREEARYDLNGSLPAGSRVTDAVPDWDGRIWFVTRGGGVGFVEPATGAVRTLHLAGEEIQNTLAVAEDGVYVVSDHALYRFERDGATGEPRATWREPYDRGTSVKPGSINRGSGTTPTLVGDDLVAISDNADGRINLLVYRRLPGHKGPRLVCAIPLFDDGRSTSENSFIAYGRSILVVNNYLLPDGAALDDRTRGYPGIVRVDVDPDRGTGTVVWESRESSPTTVPKMSAASGLVYVYTRREGTPDSVQAWYLTALDFRTGRTVFQVLAGTGRNYNNNYAPITLGPDGTAYIGCFNGIVAVRDGKPGAGR